MHWRNQKEWMLWNDRKIKGSIYSFQHLRSFDMALIKETKGDLAEFRATIRVVFDCHVVTEKADIAAYDAQDSQYWKDTGGNCRRFDLKRYTHSLKLPTLISGLPSSLSGLPGAT